MLLLLNLGGLFNIVASQDQRVYLRYEFPWKSQRTSKSLAPGGGFAGVCPFRSVTQNSLSGEQGPKLKITSIVCVGGGGGNSSKAFASIGTARHPNSNGAINLFMAKQRNS